MMLYSSLLAAALLLGSPYWLFRMLTSGHYRAGLSERLGRVSPGLHRAILGHRILWLHAVSVGEMLAASGLIRALEAALPGHLVAISTTTETGQRLARERFPGNPVFYLPLDFATLMRRTLRLFQPRLVILMESELWPNLIHECARAGIPLAVANARISDRSLPRYLRLRRLWRPRLAEITLFLAQSDEAAHRLASIGVPSTRIRNPGNLKYDLATPQPTPRTQLLAACLPDTPILLCGSTLEGEESLLLGAWRKLKAVHPDAILIVAPRHPDRFQAVANLLSAQAPITRVRDLQDASTPLSAGSIVLLDTIGDLASAYALATVAFVGGSLVPAGGHNPLEPVRFGVPTVIGSFYENFREIVHSLKDADAIRIAIPTSLAAVLLELLNDPNSARAVGQRGQELFARNAGVTDRIVAELTGLLQ